MLKTDPHSKGLHVFVDGTGGPVKIKEGVVARSGWGVSGWRDGKECYIQCGYVVPQVSTNCAELHALIHGLAYLNQLVLSEPANVWTDSRYAMDCVANMADYAAREFRLANGELMKNHEQILLVHDYLFRLELSPMVIIRWVKGHLGIPGNERADALSKEGAYKGEAYYDFLR